MISRFAALFSLLRKNPRVLYTSNQKKSGFEGGMRGRRRSGKNHKLLQYVEVEKIDEICISRLSVGFGNSLELILERTSTSESGKEDGFRDIHLLLDGVAVGRSFCGVDKLIGQAFLQSRESTLDGCLSRFANMIPRTEMVLTFLNADSLTPMVMSAIDWLTLLKGETSTA
jgi:hypothetical protein